MNLWVRWWATPDLAAASVVGGVLLPYGVLTARFLLEWDLVPALVSGLVFGAAGFAMMLIRRRNRRRDVRRVLDTRPTTISEHDVHRAVWGGPVPADPGTRAAALDVVLRQLDREPPWGLQLAVFALWLVTAVPRALHDAPGWWPLIGLWGVALTMTRSRTRVLRRCADRLRGAPESVAG